MTESTPQEVVVLGNLDLQTLSGDPMSLDALDGQALLIVNVASHCGMTPHYAGLQRLFEKYGTRGFTVIGVPCNQFGEQEPGTAEEIATFCSTNYTVTFPLLAKTDVNGEERHPLFADLTKVANERGKAGDVRWNFEKFLVAPDRRVVARFSSGVEPEAPELVEALEAILP